MNETTLEHFTALYRIELERAVREHPDEYAYPAEAVPQVVETMIAAIRHDRYNKDSRAIKAVCKTLGIKHTYTAIREYLT